jgi:predicted dinucleotide-binding enzyme
VNIGVLGAGNVGGALGGLWAARGHRVRFARRRVAEGVPAEAAAGDVAVTDVPAAVQFGDAVLLATPWAVTEEVLRAAGDFGGRILIDATNPIAPGLALAAGHTQSGGELVAGWARGARVVKCFNTLGADGFARPGTGEAQASLFYCGDDADAKSTVRALGEELGFDMVDCGPLARARLTEPLALLWISLAMQHGFGRDIAFRLLRR